MSNNSVVGVPLAAIVVGVITVGAYVLVDEWWKGRKYRARIDRELFQRRFKERFGADVPSDSAERLELEPEVMRRIEVVGSFQGRIPELVANQTRAGSPDAGVVIILTGVLDQVMGGTKSQYIEMRELALKAGYRPERLLEIDRRVQQRIQELSAA